MSVLVLEVFTLCLPCAMGLELGTAGVQQCPQCAALAARAQGTWLDGMGADSVPKLLLQCCWKGHLELS